MDELISWFCGEGGSLDSSFMGLADIPGQGRGAVVLQDIPEGHTLFTIPRPLTLSTRTSSLPGLVGAAAWKSLQLDKGWVGLILCMMWEETLGERSKWAGYLRSLPNKFDTPMFWSEDELRMLEGTTLVDKIGKEEAERDYREKLVPALQSRPDLFAFSSHSVFYSLDNYHLMGSRILSRSFQVERWEGQQEVANEEQSVVEGAMEVDGEEAAPHEEPDVGVIDVASVNDDDDEDEEDPSDVTMVPMADMLNARYGSENAKLFYEQTELKMVTTKPIKAGDQIYNTYGDLPNSDLLRRYGHIDLIPLPNEGNGDTVAEGNPADVIEITADLVVEVVALHLKKSVDDDALKERIDWWLEEGGDDTFVLEANTALPDSLVSFLKLLLCPEPDWEKARDKGKPPKPKLEAQVVPLVLALLQRRMEKYPTTLEHDEALLGSSSEMLSNNERNALFVRMGEKRILKSSLARIERLRGAAPGDAGEKGKDGAHKKRRGEDRTESSKRNKR
ncbi:hypothetical protein M0805_002853 [Coniferiporia weirii]|nr:hypothetical protein M0805_002853 [Coniferiporia weirii]